MGYYVEQLESNIYIAKSDIDAAWQSLRSVFIPTQEDNGMKLEYAWVSSRGVLDAQSFKDALFEARWDAYFEDGNLVELCFNGEKLGDDDIILGSLSKFMRNGSYIIMRGEDGAVWKWKFWNGQLLDLEGWYVFEGEQ